ncbi:MAG TPA: SOS response-associated peptidase [Polyangiales bacterium]|nr:SOS response-associated peptidase [Polyangiales bacterium]
MCGRFVVTVPDLTELADEFGVQDNRAGLWLPHYNLAPTQLAPVITNEPQRALAQMRFGLQPFWAKSNANNASMINARVETIATKPAYKKALVQRRCVIPVSGYYEWQKVGTKKQPVYIHAKNGKLIPLSGVWERWTTRDGGVIESFAIVTRAAEGFMRDIHDRMPLEVPRDQLDLWLDPKEHSAEELTPILDAASGTDHLVFHPVATLVNSVGNDGPELIQPYQPEPERQLDLFATPAKKPRGVR